MKFRYIEFDQDLNEIVSRENNSGSNLFICPNYSSLKALQKAYQEVTALQKVEFLTMEKYKELFLLSKLPPVKEDKRTLAFYASLSEKHKDHFHIRDYFQSISFAHQFFTFFEELAEELVSFEAVQHQIEKRLTEDQWQKETFDILLEIRASYNEYLEKHGFSDLIFAHIYDKPSSLIDYDNVIVVNQFYLTSREKMLLPEHTVIYLQLPEELYDISECRCSIDFTAGYLKKCNTKAINIQVFPDEFSLKCYLFSQELDQVSDLLIDTGILRDHLERYSPACISTFPFKRSTLFTFFENLHFLLNGLILQDNNYLIEINSILSVISDQQFLRNYSDENITVDEFNIIWEELYNWIYLLIDRDVKYIDLSLKLVTIQPSTAVQELLFKIFHQILIFKNVTDSDHFFNILQSFDLKKIISNEECCCSDLPEVYYQLLFDFKAVTGIGIIENWQLIFPQNKAGFDSGNAFLKLFLNYAGNKYFRFNRPDDQIRIPEITSLNNTRNLICDHVYIVDAVEGNLPPARKTPFFFTESQRAELKLKTYSDIVLREKYYFLRLVAQSKEVTILSRSQEKDTTEISSFVEELKLYKPHFFETGYQKINCNLKYHLKNWLKPSSADLSVPVITEDFDILPFSRKIDLRNNVFPVSPSSVNLLIEHPFLYYIQNILRLQPRDLKIDMDFTPRQLGNIIHKAFAAIWLRLKEVYQGSLIHHDFRFNQHNYAGRALDNYLMTSPGIILELPYNYSQLYFEKIVKRFICDSIEHFLRLCDDKYSNIQIRIIPEIESKLQRCRLFQLNEIEVVTFGAADLRIEIIPEHCKHIYDYKSGKFSKSSIKDYTAQLAMYEKLYYKGNDNVEKYIYFVTDQEIKAIKDQPDDLVEQIRESVNEILTTGYRTGNSKFKYEDEELTRRSFVNHNLRKNIESGSG